MTSKIKIASAQYPITEHQSIDAWRNHINTWTQRAVQQGADVLLFPEYGSMELVSIFGKAVQSDLKQQIHALNGIIDEFITSFQQLSQRYGVTILAPSFPVVDEGSVVNRAFVFSKNGLGGYQDKFFMTRFEDEEWGVKSGEKVLTVFESDWGKFGIQICYDIEFPIGSALLAQAGAHVIFVPSCTETIRGATRVHIGARARALENQVYTVVAQTVGEALWSPAVDLNYGYAGFYSTPDRFLPEEGILQLGTAQDSTWVYSTLDLSLIPQVRNDGQVFCFKDFQKVSLGLKDEEITIRHVRI